MPALVFPRKGLGLHSAASHAPRERSPFREGKPGSWRGKSSCVRSSPGVLTFGDCGITGLLPGKGCSVGVGGMNGCWLVLLLSPEPEGWLMAQSSATTYIIPMWHQRARLQVSLLGNDEIWRLGGVIASGGGGCASLDGALPHPQA